MRIRKWALGLCFVVGYSIGVSLDVFFRGSRQARAGFGIHAHELNREVREFARGLEGVDNVVGRMRAEHALKRRG